MRDFIKAFASCVVAAALTLSTFGASTTLHLAANSGGSILTNAARITQVTLANTNATTSGYIVFYDSPSATNQYTLASYTSNAFLLFSTTNSWTNYFGVVNSNVYSYYSNQSATVSASTNLYPTILAVDYGSNSTVNLPILLRPNLGLYVTNTASVDVTIVYTQ